MAEHAAPPAPVTTARPRLAGRVRDPLPWLLALLTLGVGLLLNARESISQDEAFSVQLARSDWSTFWWNLVHDQANMSPHFVLLRGWEHLGTSESVLRALSAIAAAATIPPLYAVCARVVDRPTGALASLLLASNAFLVGYAQEIRGYTLALFLTTLSCLLFLRFADVPSPGRSAAYAVVSALAVYAHFFAAYVLAAQLVAAAVRVGRGHDVRAALRRLAPPYLGMAVLLAPLAWYFATQPTNQLWWVHTSGLRGLASVLAGMAGGSRILLVAYLALSVLGVWRLVWSAERPPGWQAALVLGWAALPVAGSFVLSQVLHPMLLTRYLIVALPGWLVIVAAGLRSLSDRRLRVVAAAALLAGSLVQLARTLDDRTHDDWRDASSLVAHDARPGDSVIFYKPYGELPFSYYAERSPALLATVRPAFPATAWRPFDFLHDPLARPDAGRLAEQLANRRVWLVAAAYRLDRRGRSTHDALVAALAAHHAQRTRRLNQVDVTLYVPSSRGSHTAP